MKTGTVLIALGLILMIFGAGSNALPTLATVNFGGENGATIDGVSDFSASFMFIGIVTAMLGLYLYRKHE